MSDSLAALHATLDPSRRSWVASANETGTDFPIQNLPYCVFARGTEAPRVGVAIGDQVVDVSAGIAVGVFRDAALEAARACVEPSMNTLMSMGRGPSRALRVQLSDWLATSASPEMRTKLTPMLIPMGDVRLLLPATVGDYTDFYASVHHATNVGRMFRPDQPLLPNYKWVPIGYHGRASSVVVSGTPITRPSGQRKAPTDDVPTVGPSRSLDYELELAAWVGEGNALGETISIDRAEQHLFGVCLLNDWSARDLQSWEYQPLGPFLAKNFASTVSPFVVTYDALEPFRAPLAPRDASDPGPLPYLSGENDRARGGLSLTLEVWLRTARMRENGDSAVRLSRSNSLDLYWSFAQMLTHHASNGCNMRAGDLIGSGTVSGPLPGSQGCLLEISKRAAEPIVLPNGESRGFLENGDEVVLRAFAEREGAVRIGFGACAGVVVGQE